MSFKNIGEVPSVEERSRIQALLDRTGEGEMFGKLRLEMGQSMNQHLAVFRDEKGMQTASEKIVELKKRYENVIVQDKGKTFNTNLIFTLELGFMLDCAEAVVASALDRKESRGAHTRKDIPKRDDKNWLKHVVVTRTEERASVSYKPVVITQWEPQERKY